MSQEMSPQQQKSILNEGSQIIESARSGKNQINYLQQDHFSGDLELLIRAHQKIRQLEQQNVTLRLNSQNLTNSLKYQKQKSQVFCKENQKLKKLNQELLSTILQLEKQLGRKQLTTINKCRQIQQIQSRETRQVNEQRQIIQFNEIFIKQSQRNQSHNKRVLNPSQSTPVILNIGDNTCPKQQRKSFLASCKQQFTHELQRIKQKQSQGNRNSSNHRSECFASSHSTQNLNQNGHSGNAFFRAAQTQFKNQNQKAKYIANAERRRSASLIRKNNLIGSRYDNQPSNILLGDKTNVFYSKNASVNHILSSGQINLPTKNTPLNKLKLFSGAQDESQHIGQDWKKQSMLKKAHKNVYYQKESKNELYSSKQKNLDSKYRKKKSQQIQLDNHNNYGIIKYRGLCL